MILNAIIISFVLWIGCGSLYTYVKEKKKREEIDFIRNEARELFLYSYLYLRDVIRNHKKEAWAKKALKEVAEAHAKKLMDLKKSYPKRPYMIDWIMDDKREQIMLNSKIIELKNTAE